MRGNAPVSQRLQVCSQLILETTSTKPTLEGVEARFKSLKVCLGIPSFLGSAQWLLSIAWTYHVLSTGLASSPCFFRSRRALITSLRPQGRVVSASHKSTPSSLLFPKAKPYKGLLFWLKSKERALHSKLSWLFVRCHSPTASRLLDT